MNNMPKLSSFRHVLFVAAPAWGHLRPFVALATKLVHERPDIIITFTTAGDFKAKLENEMDRYFTKEEKELKDHIRLLQLGDVNATGLIETFRSFTETFNNLYPNLYEEKPVSCNTGQVIPAVTRPDVILLDPFLYDILKGIRKVSGSKVPVLAWNTASLNAMLRYFGPQSLGGLGNEPLLKAEKLAKGTGESYYNILGELYQPHAGEVVELPGLPPMYDYEFNSHNIDPHTLAFSNEVVFAAGYKAFQECDGVVSLGNVSYEPKICAAYRTWFAPRPVYFVGPFLPDEVSADKQLSHSQEKELNGSPNGAEIKALLENTQKSHGDYSLLYISFGTVFWPVGETVWKMLDIVLDMKIPLILSLNPRIEMPSYLQEKFKASQLAVVTPWAPQHVILGHRATGFFMTHCGNNSITEAVAHGVPLIAWPLAADQQVNAAYISTSLNIAYELFETRVNDGLRPLCRGIKPTGTPEAAEEEFRSVLSKAWGIDGIQKRENIHALQRKVSSAWKEDGDARKELREFLNKFVPQ